MPFSGVKMESLNGIFSLFTFGWNQTMLCLLCLVEIHEKREMPFSLGKTVAFRITYSRKCNSFIMWKVFSRHMPHVHIIIGHS